MVRNGRLTVAVLMGIGILLGLVIPERLGDSASQELRLAVSFVGGLLLWTGAIWDDVRRRSEGIVDERYAAIHYRAGWYAFAATIALLVTIGISTSVADMTVEAGPVIPSVAVAGLLVYFGTVAVLKRTM